MAGNSRRRGAMRKPGTKKGAVVGSGGQKSKRLQGKGPTPKAENRTGHPAARRTRAAAKHAAKNGSKGSAAKNPIAKGPAAKGPVAKNPAAKADAARQRRKGGQDRTPELVAGRNPVAECLRAGAPATALYVALGIDADERVTEAMHLAAERGVSVLEVSRSELDRLTGGALHQGLALSVPPFEYTHPDDLLSMATESGEPPLLVALDGV
ncbi:MAG: RNA methyltransferase substrate-binding domain-containing protein, partial [Sciscionella sp.]